MIKTKQSILKTQKWLHQTDLEKLNKAIAWSKQHRPVDNFKKFTKI